MITKGFLIVIWMGPRLPHDVKKWLILSNGGDADFFVISLKAGGTGLNLTAADTVIILDPWWNPATEEQAADRAHRIGQQRNVTVYRYVCRHTIEEKVLKLKQHKCQLVDSFMAGTTNATGFTLEELRELL